MKTLACLFLCLFATQAFAAKMCVYSLNTGASASSTTYHRLNDIPESIKAEIQARLTKLGYIPRSELGRNKIKAEIKIDVGLSSLLSLEEFFNRTCLSTQSCGSLGVGVFTRVRYKTDGFLGFLGQNLDSSVMNHMDVTADNYMNSIRNSTLSSLDGLAHCR